MLILQILLGVALVLSTSQPIKATEECFCLENYDEARFLITVMLRRPQTQKSLCVGPETTD